MLNPIGIQSEVLGAAPAVYTQAPRSRGTFVAVLKAAVAFVRVVLRTDRLDLVINFVDALAALPVVTAPIAEQMRGFEQGERALREKIRVGRIDLEALKRCAPDSFGRSFVEYLNANGLDPTALPTRRAQTDHEYVSAHLYETHDLWHVATGFKTNEAGELGLQAFHLAQVPNRVAVGILAIGMVQTIFKGFADRNARLDQIVRGWTLGRQAAPLIGLDWKTLWDVPLAEVRRRLRLVPTVESAPAQ
jgi:ubiquinone biosynthesis protein COQ4